MSEVVRIGLPTKKPKLVPVLKEIFMKNIIEQIHKRKKAAVLITVAFFCIVAGIVYTISKPQQIDESPVSSSPVSSSIKVKVANAINTKDNIN